jgi:hypothetical protein
MKPLNLRQRTCAWSVAASLLHASAVFADIAPLPPLPESMPETLPTDQFAVDSPLPPVPTLDQDNAWLTPAKEPAEKPPAPASSEPAEAALEGPPTPLPPIERLSSGAVPPQSMDGDGKPITLNLKNADLAAVLNTFAKFSGVNIVASEKIRGQVPLNLVDVPWRRAFDTLLEVHGLAMERHGDVIWVAPLTELAAREKLRFEAHARCRPRAAFEPHVRAALPARRRREKAPDRRQARGKAESSSNEGHTTTQRTARSSETPPKARLPPRHQDSTKPPICHYSAARTSVDSP